MRRQRMPVPPMHPARVEVHRLRPGVDDGPPSADAHILRIPHVDAAEQHRAWRKIKRLAATQSHRSLMNTRSEPDDFWIVLPRDGLLWRIRKEKQHLVLKAAGTWSLDGILAGLRDG